MLNQPRIQTCGFFTLGHDKKWLKKPSNLPPLVEIGSKSFNLDLDITRKLLINDIPCPLELSQDCSEKGNKKRSTNGFHCFRKKI